MFVLISYLRVLSVIQSKKGLNLKMEKGVQRCWVQAKFNLNSALSWFPAICEGNGCYKRGEGNNQNRSYVKLNYVK